MRSYFYCALLFLICVVGCNSNARVSGTITYKDGTPVKNGSVVFDGVGYQATGPLNENGQYELGEINPGDGIKPGSYKVRIAGAMTGGDSDGSPLVRYVAAKYENSETSDLTFEVKKGKQVFDFQVEKFK